MKNIIFPVGMLCLMLIAIACNEPYVDPYSIHTVTFNAEGGAFSDNTSRVTMQTDAKGRISSLPAVTRVEANKTYHFEGWFTPGGTRVTVQTVFHDDTLVVARWREPNAGETDERGPLARTLEALMDNPRNLTFTVSAGETLGPQSFEFEELQTPIEIVLNGTQAVYTLSLSGFGSLFTVGNNVTLRLRNIRLQGHGKNTASLIDIKSGGRVIIESGTVITGNDTESIKHGGGVTVNTGGELVMPADAGLIYQNTSAHMSDWISGDIGGGGVWVRGGTFTMSGGKIEENASIGGGGVLVTQGGTFTMSGGEIIKCIAQAVGGGVRVAGYRSDAEPITPNNPDGRRGSTFTMTGGKIYEGESSSGGGVEVGWHGTFTMKGGEICKNTALSGGGVYNLRGVFLLYDGGTIYENKALGEAGGVMNAGLVEMWGGAINNNESLGNAGGVMHTPSGSGLLHNFFMYAGEINGNTAQGGGGGLYTISSFDMYGGQITGNTAHSTGGGGVLVGSPGLVLDYGEFTITDGEISNNKSYASGENSDNLAVRGLGKARTAKLGIYWFDSTFTETITEAIFDGNNYLRSETRDRTFTGGTPVPDVPYYFTPKDEGGTPSLTETKTLYFIPTPLVKPSPPPETYEDRGKVQGSIRIAIGEPRVERIAETVVINGVVVTERDVIAMDMDAVKFANNETRNITVAAGEATYVP